MAEVYSLGELLAEPPRRRDWGPWRLDPTNYVLFIPFDLESTSDDHMDGFQYWVPVDECLDSAAVLDWYHQLCGKGWADDAVLAGLMRAIDDLLIPQANLCGCGAPKSITPEQARQRVREVSKWAA